MATVTKKAIDLMYSFIARIGASSHCDRFGDGTLKLVQFFGLVATYVVAPDGTTHTAIHAACNLSEARKVAWAFHEATLLRWVETAESFDLVIELAREASLRGHNKSLVNLIRKELDQRTSQWLKAVA